MPKPNPTVIRLLEANYTRLKLAKGSDSFDTYIGKMLNYFSITQVAPESVQTHPISMLKNEIDRIIKIVKAQEKKYVSEFDNIKNLLGSSSNIIQKENSISDEVVGSDLTIEELQQLVDVNEKQKEQIYLLEQEKQKQQTTISSLNLQLSKGGSNVNKTAILQSIEALKEKATSMRLAEGQLQISSIEFHSILDRIKQECS